MGEKKNDGGNKNNSGGNGKKENGEKKEKQTLTVVLKVDMHCDGCASKISKHLRRFEGVETVKTETGTNKVTVVGVVDPAVLREKLSQKTKKKVDLISPQPPKKADNNNPEKKEKKPEKEKNPDDGGSSNKKKETPAATTTAVLKLGLHCQGCINKIRKTISKTKGVKEVSVDEQKELVTVKGTMDIKALTEVLNEKLKRPVEVVPPKKEKEGGGDNNGNGGGGAGNGKKKNKGNDSGGDGGNGKEETDNRKLEGNKLEHHNQFMIQPGFGFGYPYEQGYYPYYPPPTYAPGYPVQVHAPQIFSDENPNACSIM